MKHYLTDQIVIVCLTLVALVCLALPEVPFNQKKDILGGVAILGFAYFWLISPNF